MRNVSFKLEYDGTDFHGFQIQPSVRTVQGAIESALTELLPEPVRITAAGRTDEGVHALGQVVNLRTGSEIPCEILERALNAKLPPDVRVLGAKDVQPDFHARFSAKSRNYEYVLTTVRSVFQRLYAWYVKYDLNFQALANTAALFKGRHDFGSFCVAKSRVDESECVVYSSVWKREEGFWKYGIEANRFLHNQVRIMVGTMVEVGRGKLGVSDVEMMLKAKDRREAGPTAPPHGLFLTEVKY